VPTPIDRAEVQRLISERSAQLVDVLNQEEFDESHIVGAVNVPLPKLPELAPERLDLTRPIITYCNGFL
jgi:rhodanese-related sulfurtransferase